MDRLWMAERPARRHSMRHYWHDLLFLHWPVPASLLQPLVPPGLTIDTFEGDAYIGLVPFRISGITANGFVPVPGFAQFLEINVRTYVHRDGNDPGVWFFSLDAANLSACLGARTAYRLPYFFARMRQTNLAGPDSTTTLYRSKRLYPGPLPANAAIDYAVQGDSTKSAEIGTLEHFLVERYLLYSATATTTFIGQVHHTPYPLQPASIGRLDENLVAAAGVTRSDSAPIVHFSRGVDVLVYPLQPV